MQPIVNIATRAARQAGDIIIRATERMDKLTIHNKSDNDYVTEVDQMAEQEIIRAIRKAYPDHAILAEESGETEGDSEYQWIIDPLDGTTNYLHQFPQYSISIAVKYRGRLEHAVVFDPLKDEMFSASRGHGAQMNGRRLRVSEAKGLNGALLGTGFPFKDLEHLDAYLAMFKSMIGPTAGIRRAGSAALDLAYVAAGRLDGFWELNLKPWDMAAGLLLIQEAGGLVSDIKGGHDIFETGHVIAANPRVFKAMVKTLHPHTKTI